MPHCLRSGRNVEYYRMTYEHTNHTTVDVVLKVTDEDNLKTQALSILYNRYRRKLGLDKVKFELLVDYKE
jgi:hypothetical protein